MAEVYVARSNVRTAGAAAGRSKSGFAARGDAGKVRVGR